MSNEQGTAEGAEREAFENLAQYLRHGPSCQEYMVPGKTNLCSCGLDFYLIRFHNAWQQSRAQQEAQCPACGEKVQAPLCKMCKAWASINPDGTPRDQAAQVAEEAARKVIEGLIDAMDVWGSWEDGIPNEFAPILADARKLLASYPTSPEPQPQRIRSVVATPGIQGQGPEVG
jgi:hypothetical protein